jgi:hypothetical protein
MVQVLQSYTRVAALIQPSVEIALRILDAGRRLRQRGLIRNATIYTHHRPLVWSLSANLDIGIVHLRYNAVHTGADRKVFPQIAETGIGQAWSRLQPPAGASFWIPRALRRENECPPQPIAIDSCCPIPPWMYA